MMRFGWWMVVAAVLAGCGAGEQDLDASEVAAEQADSERTAAYEVVLGNAITDTLRGNATFGRVRDPEENERYFVVRLASNFDFGGGVVITRNSPEFPEEGTVDLSADSSRIASGEDFFIVYREGMLRDLRSVSGSLTFSTVNDSLIEGQFDATLRGYISERGRDIQSADVHAVGRFSAKRGMSGYVIGL